MTIGEVLLADWDVDKIAVTVRDNTTMRYISGYKIGRDVKPGLSERFQYETEAGDVYGESNTKKLYINRIIQFYQLEKKPRGKEMCRGVLVKEIPKEILGLTIDQMYPYDFGGSNGLHGYDFNCCVDCWKGISGEKNKQSEVTTMARKRSRKEIRQDAKPHFDRPPYQAARLLRE